MDWKARDLTTALKTAPDKLPPLILVYGEDSGMVRKHVADLAKHILPDINDPFASDRISASDLVESPSLIADAAATISFGGGMRLVRLEDFAADTKGTGQGKITEAVTEALLAYADTPSANAVVLVAAPLLDAKTALATKLARHKNAAALRVYADKAQDIGTVVNQAVQAAGKRIAADARTFLVENLGNDRGVTTAELEKLVLYTQDKDEITLADCLNVIAAAPSVNIFKLCDAIGHRDSKQVDNLLRFLAEEGEDMVYVHTMALRHIRRLLQCKERIAQGTSPMEAVKTLRPPVAPFMQGDFLNQVNGMPLPRLRTALSRLEQMVEASRSKAVPADLILRRGLLGLSL
ncbi:MAG: DNA polymerase III subunit delta [Proteobacteria bacterium]|nr:DNA polymerase III subunit delta [Pseudomonadota bacterium]